MDRMNPLESAFLDLEDGVAHMHIASCAIFEGPPPPFADVVAAFAAKLALVPRYRQRVRSVPLLLGRPVWVDDPHFELEYHLRHTALPPPGGEIELEALMGRLMSQELDRNRPLWETWVVEGLQGGRWAMIGKVHHCMIDGIAGTDLMATVLDLERRTEPPAPPPRWKPEPEPSAVWLVADVVSEELRRSVPPWPLGGADRDPRQALKRLGPVIEGLSALVRTALRPVPDSSLDGPIGPHRRWAMARGSLEDIGTVRRVLGGTVNDVVLAAVAGAFRTLLRHRGENPAAHAVRSLVPVSVRPPEARGVYDNRVSGVFLDLPVEVEQPQQRLEEVRRRMAALKASHEAEAGETLTALVGRAPVPLVAEATRVVASLMRRRPQRASNTVTTNVPGPQFPLYARGRQMLEYFPFVPLSPGVRVAVAILSYNGKMAFGVTGDYDKAPDVGIMASAIETELAELQARAEWLGRRSGRRADRHAPAG